MHLFYRILCLIQFVQIRAAKPYNYGLDKEIVLQNRTEQNPTLKWCLLGKNCTYSFVRSLSKHLLSTYPIPVTVCGAGNTKVRPSLAELTDI